MDNNILDIEELENDIDIEELKESVKKSNHRLDFCKKQKSWVLHCIPNGNKISYPCLSKVKKYVDNLLKSWDN